MKEVTPEYEIQYEKEEMDEYYKQATTGYKRITNPQLYNLIDGELSNGWKKQAAMHCRPGIVSHSEADPPT